VAVVEVEVFAADPADWRFISERNHSIFKALFFWSGRQPICSTPRC